MVLDYSLNDSCISPAHAQRGSSWAPVYGRPAGGTKTKNKRISFFLVPFTLFPSHTRSWTIIVQLFDHLSVLFTQLLLILLLCVVTSCLWCQGASVPHKKKWFLLLSMFKQLFCLIFLNRQDSLMNGKSKTAFF